MEVHLRLDGIMEVHLRLNGVMEVHLRLFLLVPDDIFQICFRIETIHFRWYAVWIS